MEPFTPETFFDLTHYAHQELFNGCTYVWEALDNLKNFLYKNLFGKIEGDVSPEALLLHPELISIGPGTTVEPGAYIQGPCIIGRDCLIRRGCYLRGSVVMGDNCVVGHGTEIKGSILLDSAQAAHFNYLGDSILGNGTNLGAGAKGANVRFDDAHVLIAGIDTKRRKLGLILGDKGQLGCNVVTNPGTVIGKGTFIAPCLNVSGVIPANQLVKK
ncbi:MAG: UDP-N-acetylglucosamine diphosphorylase [Verrucomicrobia bacterium]|nr:UDP-N-acetylglucosamine diphosphorylase [Verrucomicrobiota bacterium]